MYEVWEFDFLARMKLTKAGEEDNIIKAGALAKKTAEGWCEDEEPQLVHIDGAEAAYVGLADFGTVVIKV